MSSRPKRIPDPPATSRFLIIASVFVCVVTLGWLRSHWARSHRGKPSDAHSHTPASGAYQPTYQPLPNGALTSLVPSRSRHLDRDWEQVVSVINRENPDGATGWNPPATDPEIVDAESLAGIKSPPELRWLLKRQNGQTADSGATFYNGTRLMSASEIADAYVMQQGIMDHIAPDRDRNIRPSLNSVAPWWPGLLPFATDGGGDCLFIDVSTSHVYADFEGSVSSQNAGAERLENPLSFSIWMNDYANRLESGRYHQHPSTGSTLWTSKPAEESR